MGRARRIVMFNWVTADGYFAAPDGNLDWVVPDEEQTKVAAADIPNFDTVLFGRRTYEIFEAFWGHAVVDAPGTVAGPPPSRATISGTRGRSDLAKQDDEVSLFPNPAGRYLEEFAPAPRARPARDRDHEGTSRQRHDCLW